MSEEADIWEMTSCPKCGLEFKTLLHRFCLHNSCPIRDAVSTRSRLKKLADKGMRKGREISASSVAEEPYPGQAPCPHCFESSGYVWEHGNDWDSGPWSHQTNIPCKHCNGTGTVDCDLATLQDLEDLASEEPTA